MWTRTTEMLRGEAEVEAHHVCKGIGQDEDGHHPVIARQKKEHYYHADAAGGDQTL